MTDLLIFLIGAAAGYLLCMVISNVKTVGVIHAWATPHDNEHQFQFLLEFMKDPITIVRFGKVSFDVRQEAENYDPRNQT